MSLRKGIGFCQQSVTVAIKLLFYLIYELKLEQRSIE